MIFFEIWNLGWHWYGWKRSNSIAIQTNIIHVCFEVVGVLCYGEVMSPLKITASILVMIGVIMLHVADSRIESGEDTQVSFLIGTPEKVVDALELQPLSNILNLLEVLQLEPFEMNRGTKSCVC